MSDARGAPFAANLGSGLTFVFSGTFEPRRLASDDLTSPFNVCQRIDASDLTIDDARRLADAVGIEQAKPFVERAYAVVGGQPFLLQYLLDAAATGDAAIPAEDRFNSEVEKLHNGESQHLQSLLQAVVSDPPVRAIAQRVLGDDEGAPYAATPEHGLVVTLGFAQARAGRLFPRNALYSYVARAHPLLGRVRQTTRAQVAPPAPGAFQFVADSQLREYAEEMAAGAFTALNNGHYRLALVGMGSVLEAILTDVLEQVTVNERQLAVRTAGSNFNGFEDPQKPETWRLINLIRVAGALPRFAHVSLQAADALRDWRNLVHPKLERAARRADEALAPETTAAQGILGILTRELS